MTTVAAPPVERLPIWERVKLSLRVRYPLWQMLCAACGGEIVLGAWHWRSLERRQVIHEDCPVPENEGKDEAK